jgi:hypothetical protein
MGAPPIQGPPYNVVELAKADGKVIITIRWDWDGVSTNPYEGSIVDIRVRNLDTVTWYARLPFKKRGQKYVSIAPGSDTTYSGGQLNNMGLDVISAIAELTLTSTAP